MKHFLAMILLAVVLTVGALAGDKKPTPTPTPAPPAVKPLSIVQMQQLTIVQTQARAAAEELEKCRAQQRALTREFAWVLGVNPEFYEAELKALDETGAQWGFVPKAAPNPPEPGKDARPEPKQDGKQ